MRVAHGLVPGGVDGGGGDALMRMGVQGRACLGDGPGGLVLVAYGV